jgi:hypothetical protein
MFFHGGWRPTSIDPGGIFRGTMAAWLYGKGVSIRQTLGMKEPTGANIHI